MPSLTIIIGTRTGPYVLTVILEMTDPADCGGSLYIKFVHLIDALSDHHHRHPYRAVRFNGRPRTKETSINRDGEMITEIRRESIKEGMK